MDIQMPVMDGLETTRRIRNGRMAKSVQDIPTVAITANATDADRDRCTGAGMNGYVSKPIRISGLEAALQEAVAEVGRSQESVGPEGTGKDGQSPGATEF